MKITIDTDIIEKYGLSFGEFLVLLVNYYGENYEDTCQSLIDKHVADINLTKHSSLIMSDYTKETINKILVESDEKVTQSEIDFNTLARKLQDIYPKGKKPGKTYDWRGDIEDIVFMLKILVARYDFSFTEEEAIKATTEYVNTFKDQQLKHMHTLRNFILYTSRNNGMESIFMTIIENNRDNV